MGRVALVGEWKFYKCDPRMIDVMVDIYMGDRTEQWDKWEVLGETGVTSGISQGWCTGSPQLFVIVINVTINNILDRNGL